MFSKRHTRPLQGLASLLTAVLLSSTAAYAQTVFIRDVPRAGVSPSPLRVEVAVEPTGRVQGAVIPLTLPTNVTLKRGVIDAQPDGSVVATYETVIAEPTEDGRQPQSDLTVQLHGAANSEGGNDGIDIILFDIVDVAVASELDWLDLSDLQHQPEPASDNGGGNDGLDIILFDIADVASHDLLELHFAPASHTEQLRCEPAYLCNTPGPGQDLIAVFSEPLSEQPVVEEWVVHSTEPKEPRLIQVRLQYLD